MERGGRVSTRRPAGAAPPRTAAGEDGRRWRPTLLGLALAVLLLTGLVVTTGGSAGASTAGGNGLIAFESTRHGSSDIYVKYRDGSGERRLTAHSKSEIDPTWSPDGTRIAFSGDETDEGHQNIYVMQADGSGKTLLTPGAQTTNEGNAGTDPSWSPDGARIVWANYGEIWVMAADGTGKTRILGGDGSVGAAPAWSPDGTRIAYITGYDIWTMAPDGSSRVRLTTTTAAERSVDWAPDGSALVYERGGLIWRMDADGSNAVQLTGTGGSGQLPAWSPDGTLIAFGTNAYGSTTSHEIATMRSDGSDVALVPPAATGTDTDPSWQPVTDTTAPTVTARSPRPNAVAVAQSGSVTASLSESVEGVDGTTFTLRTGTGTPVSATVAYDAATRTATLDPSDDLAADTLWTAELRGGTSGIRDLAGNPMRTVRWSFTTGPRPTVVSRSPRPNAKGVTVGASVTATFDEDVQAVGDTTFTLQDGSGTQVAATITYDPVTRVATLDPAASLARDTVWTATLTGGRTAIRDLAGNPLRTLRWSFTTGPRPTVVSRSPASDATGVAPSADVTATFSEAVQGVGDTTFTLRDASGTAVTATVTYDPGTGVAELDPAVDLAPGTTWTAILTGGNSGIRDIVGNPLRTVSWNFTTGS